MDYCAIVYNPNSGTKEKNQEFTKNVEKILEKFNYKVNFFETKKQKDATNIVSKLEDDYKLVIVVGGDGTLNEAIAGNLMREKKLVLGSIPMGTTNDVGNMYGYTKNYKKNFNLLLKGCIKKIDVCRVNTNPFIYVACFGNYVDVSYATPRKLKKKYGRLAYILCGAKRITKKMKSYKIEYEVNGEKQIGEYTFLFITNGNRVAGMNGIYEDVKLDDGMFEVAFCKAKNKRELIKLIPSLITMNIKKDKKINYYRTNHLKITFLDKVVDSWCLDGEEFHSNNNIFEFDIVSNMEMLLPRKNVQKLFTEDNQI